jgi:hypothetical protein
MPKYPEIKAKLIGQDGNAFAIIGTVQRSLRKGGVPSDEISTFVEEATSGDYNNVITTAMKWVTVK